MVTFEQIRSNEEINTYIRHGNEALGAIGYTEHSFGHATLCANKAYEILEKVGCPKRECELAKIAGYMHDIGNVINRNDHAQSGAVMAFRILDKLGMDSGEIATIITAIGNHDEQTAAPVNMSSAALILADKSDVRRSRVRNTDATTFDIHDRVNYAVLESKITVNPETAEAALQIQIDTELCPVMDYFEIFLERMMLCKKAAAFLGLRFRLEINNAKIL